MYMMNELSTMADDDNSTRTGILRVFSFKFTFIDIRLATGTGVAAGLLLAKIWNPALSFEWYWYLIAMFALMMKPMLSFYAQLFSENA